MRDLKVISRMFIERRAQIVHVSKRNIGKYIVSRAVNKMLYDHYITNTFFFLYQTISDNNHEASTVVINISSDLDEQSTSTTKTVYLLFNLVTCTYI